MEQRRRSEPIAVAFAEGVLTVAVPDETWQRQLQSFSRQYLAALNQISSETVNRINFVLVNQLERRNSRKASLMVTEKDVSYVADLAHLELTAEERARMLKDLNSILGYIDRLNQLDTSDVEPMAQVASRYGERKHKDEANGFAYAMRADELQPCLPREEALRNAPASDGTFFKVPR